MDARKIGLADINFRAYKYTGCSVRKATRDCRRKMAKRAKLKSNRDWKREMLP